MAGIKSAYLRSKLVKHAIGKAAFTMPTTAYLALYSSDPTVNDTGTEITGGSYARQAITWGTEANGTIANSSSVTFSSMPASTVTHWGIRDASSGGNLLYFGPFEIGIVLAAASSFPINTGDIQISEV